MGMHALSESLMGVPAAIHQAGLINPLIVLLYVMSASSVSLIG